MWAGCGYLTFVNYFIGKVEAWLLRRVHPGPKHREDIVMVLANYASMFAGIGLVWLGNRLISGTDWNLVRWGWVYIGGMWMVAFALTMLVESPFVARTLVLPWRSRSVFVATLKVNLATYAVLLAVVWLVGSVSLYTKGRFVTTESLDATPATVFFLRDDSVWKVRIDGSGESLVKRAPVPDGWLAAMPTKDGKRAGLYLVKEYDDQKPEALLADIGHARQTAPNPEQGFYFAQPGYGTQRDMRPGKDRRWQARAGFWPLEGLRINGRESYFLAVETPFLMLFWRNLTILPGDFGVVEVGGHIVVVHLPTARLAVLARGVNPTVLLDEPLATATYER